jgi:hypothetical protein
LLIHKNIFKKKSLYRFFSWLIYYYHLLSTIYIISNKLDSLHFVAYFFYIYLSENQVGLSWPLSNKLPPREKKKQINTHTKKHPQLTSWLYENICHYFASNILFKILYKLTYFPLFSFSFHILTISLYTKVRSVYLSNISLLSTWKCTGLSIKLCV